VNPSIPPTALDWFCLDRGAGLHVFVSNGVK
jgi:hypothetical protein